MSCAEVHPDGHTPHSAAEEAAAKTPKAQKSVSTLMLEQLTSKRKSILEPVGGKRKRSLEDLRQIVWAKEQAAQKSLQATQEAIMQQLARNREKSCCLLLDCIRNACKVQKVSVFKLSDLIRLMLDYKALVEMLSMDDPKKRVKVELKELIYRLVELAPEFISVEDHSIILKGDTDVTLIGADNENTNSNVSHESSEPQLYVRVNLLCSYSGVRSKLKDMTSSSSVINVAQ
jgi:hypothetical protein